MVTLLQAAIITSLAVGAAPQSSLYIPPPPPLPAPAAPQYVIPPPPPPPSGPREIQASGTSDAPAVNAASAAAPAAAAVEGDGAIDVSTGAAPEAEPEASHSVIGAQLDVGVPEGLGLSAVLRPVPVVRLHGGVLTYGGAAGLRGGVTIAPWSFAFTPTFTAEGGHLFTGAPGGAAESFVAPAKLPDDMIESLSYDFFSAQLGVEIGAPDHFVFFIRAGLSWVDALLHGTRADISGGKGTTFLDPGEIKLNLTMPSVKLGLAVYFG